MYTATEEDLDAIGDHLEDELSRLETKTYGFLVLEGNVWMPWSKIVDQIVKVATRLGFRSRPDLSSNLFNSMLVSTYGDDFMFVDVDGTNLKFRRSKVLLAVIDHPGYIYVDEVTQRLDDLMDVYSADDDDDDGSESSVLSIEPFF
jgi:hypothetical protein